MCYIIYHYFFTFCYCIWIWISLECIIYYCLHIVLKQRIKYHRDHITLNKRLSIILLRVAWEIVEDCILLWKLRVYNVNVRSQQKKENSHTTFKRKTKFLNNTTTPQRITTKTWALKKKLSHDVVLNLNTAPTASSV